MKGKGEGVSKKNTKEEHQRGQAWVGSDYK
jgi:hypothetical protein